MNLHTAMRQARLPLPVASEWDVRVEARAADLLEDATNLAQAEDLAWNWELLVNHEPELIRLTADAWSACITRCWDPESKRKRLAALGAEVMDLVLTRVRSVAAQQIDREEA